MFSLCHVRRDHFEVIQYQFRSVHIESLWDLINWASRTTQVYCRKFQKKHLVDFSEENPGLLPFEWHDQNHEKKQSKQFVGSVDYGYSINMISRYVFKSSEGWSLPFFFIINLRQLLRSYFSLYSIIRKDLSEGTEVEASNFNGIPYGPIQHSHPLKWTFLE